MEVQQRLAKHADDNKECLCISFSYDNQVYDKAHAAMDAPANMQTLSTNKWFTGKHCLVVTNWIGRPVCIFHHGSREGAALTYLPYHINKIPSWPPTPISFGFVNKKSLAGC